MKTSEKIDLILPALMAVKAKLQAVTKLANNPFFKSKYADLNTYLEEVEPLLEQNEMVLFQPIKVNDTGTNIVSSIIMHKSGQFISSEMVVVVKEADMQKMGSAITYARRYTLGPLLSMKAEDDDGNAASGKEKTTKSQDINKSNTIVSTLNPSVLVKSTQTTVPSVNKPSFRRPKTTSVQPNISTETAVKQDDI